MAQVIGIDPGQTGALAVYDTVMKGIVTIVDMPTMKMIINKKQRTRIDAVKLYDWLESQKMCGVELVMLESIGGRPQQSARNAFVLGYGVGLIYMACVALKLPIETVTPTVWKKIMKLPGKIIAEGTKVITRKGKQVEVPRKIKNPEVESFIVNRACELMPDARHYFHGPMGGRKVDRAEAAMLAKYAGDYALKLEIKPPAAMDWEIYADRLNLGA